MENKRVYPSTQMVLYLSPNVLKTLMWILGWQGKAIIYYEKQYSKALKMEVEEVERCIQSLVDKNILSVTRVDEKWVLEPVQETFKKFFEVQINKVIESDKMLQMADKITWNVEEVEKNNSFSSISDDQLEKMIQELQRRREEKKKGCQVIYAKDPIVDDFDQLPF